MEGEDEEGEKEEDKEEEEEDDNFDHEGEGEGEGDEGVQEGQAMDVDIDRAKSTQACLESQAGRAALNYVIISRPITFNFNTSRKLHEMAMVLMCCFVC